jgi:hypothetical protein
MYSVDARDEVVELSAVPPPATGAPQPTVLATEERLLLVYSLPGLELGQIGPAGRMVMPEDLPEGYDPTVILEFVRPLAHFFGPPNDEALSGHPLASHGLSSHAAFEVRFSSWIREMEIRNRDHERHDATFFEGHRHFIVTFHDSTFECVAQDFKVATFEASPPAWVRQVMQLAFG